MKIPEKIFLIPFVVLLFMSGAAMAAYDENDWAPTPPRLSYTDGEVSYWRTGSDGWISAMRNLPIAEGDALYTGDRAMLELQIASHSFIRADENSEISLTNQDEHFIQFKVATGLVSFDIGSIAAADTIEIDTPHAVFTINHPGYYRVEVDGQTTHFITHRGGRASVSTEEGRHLSIFPSEDIVVDGNHPATVASYAAPPPDAWDRWNRERSDRINETVSARYLPSGVYGAEELDHYGYWRVVPEYGPVWMPYSVAPGWVPYSTGYWVWDPYYEWTWIDDAPWGWAPSHYGRWVLVGSYWAWAPGPVVRRPVYSPALVAFMVRGDHASVRMSMGLPGVWWVALSWGEPVLPWWGSPERRGHPHWRGWGGPRAAFREQEEHRYRNADHPRAVLTVPHDKFGRERVRAIAVDHFRREEFSHVRSELPVRPDRTSVSGGAPRGIAPPREVRERGVVSSRAPRMRSAPWNESAPAGDSRSKIQPTLVSPPARRSDQTESQQRPPYGSRGGQEREPQPLPPRFDEADKASAPPHAGARSEQKPAQQRQESQPWNNRQEERAPKAKAGHRERRQEQVQEQEQGQELPGQPANRMYQRGERKSRRWESREER